MSMARGAAMPSMPAISSGSWKAGPRSNASSWPAPWGRVASARWARPRGSSPARRPSSSSPAMSSPSSRSAESFRSDVEDDLGEPAAPLGPDDQPMPRGRLDLVVEDMPVPIDRLTGDCRFQMIVAGVDIDVEAVIESMPGLATVDQLVEPTEQEV